MDAPTAWTALALLETGLLIAVVAHALRRRAALRAFVVDLSAALPVDVRPPRGASSLVDLGSTIAVARDLLIELGHRAPGRHPVTGLATREVLMAAIASSGDGLLGVVELSDFDALSAQDIDSAETVLKLFADRAIRMTGADRTIAQIDRARFAIWFAHRDAGDARLEYEALTYALGDRIAVGALDLVPRVGIGLAVRAGADEPGSKLLARAIGSLGSRSRPGASVGTPEDVALSRERVALAHDLRHAVARHQFVLHYQPFVDAERGTVCGAEALIRWNHPERGMISPGVFVPLVEETGLAEEVGLWVLDTAICEAARWRGQGLPQVKVAANLSAHQLTRPDLDRVIDRMLARHGLPPQLLELELTETAAALDSAAVAGLFDRLRRRGVAVSIDDFGAGYSSLSYLRRLKFDKLKIDREFVTRVDSDRQNQAICQSIIALGRGLGIAVLAEGVERPEEYLWLRRHGARFFQGYYFAKPFEAAGLVAFARDGATLADRLAHGPAHLQKKLGVLAA